MLHKLVKHVNSMRKSQFNWTQWSKTHTCACSSTPSHNYCFESHISLFPWGWWSIHACQTHIMTAVMIYAPTLTKSRNSVGKPPLGVYGDMQYATFSFLDRKYTQGMCIWAWPFISGCVFVWNLSMLSRNTLHLQENPLIHKQGAVFGGTWTLGSFIAVVLDYFIRTAAEKPLHPELCVRVYARILKINPNKQSADNLLTNFHFLPKEIRKHVLQLYFA